QDDRQGDGGRQRIKLGARADADEEQCIDACYFVGFAAGDGVVETADLDRAGAAGDAKRRILPAGERRLHLADTFYDADEPWLGRAEWLGQLGVLDAEAGDARRLQLLDRALHIERIAVAVVGIDQERQVAGAIDAVGLARELAQG